jgi:hypothetical protein
LLQTGNNKRRQLQQQQQQQQLLQFSSSVLGVMAAQVLWQSWCWLI